MNCFLHFKNYLHYWKLQLHFHTKKSIKCQIFALSKTIIVTFIDVIYLFSFLYNFLIAPKLELIKTRQVQDRRVRKAVSSEFRVRSMCTDFFMKIYHHVLPTIFLTFYLFFTSAYVHKTRFIN